MERRLAAIVATDIVGYTRLVEADEELTISFDRWVRADQIDGYTSICRGSCSHHTLGEPPCDT